MEPKQEVKAANNPSFLKKEASPIKVNMNLGEKMRNRYEDVKLFKKNASELQIDAGITDSREKSPLKPIANKQICKVFTKSIFLISFSVNYREIRDAYKEQSHNNEGN